MAIEKTIYINVEGAEAINEIDDINEGLEETTDITDEIGDQALAAAGSFKIMGVSVNQVIGTLKKLKITLISTGIGAIAVAVGTLAAAFFSTQEGANLVTKVMEPLSEVMNTIWGILQEMGSAMAKILSGDFVGGWEEMGRAVEDMGLKMKIAVGRGNEMADLQIRLQKTEASYIRTLSDLNLQRERYRAAVDDETLSLEERQKSLVKLEAVNNGIYNLQKARQEDELKLLQLKTEANDTDYAAKVEIAQKEAELNEAAARREKQRKEEFLISRRLLVNDEKDVRDKVDPLTGLSINDLATIETETGVHLDNMNALYQGYADQQNRISSENANANVRIEEEKAAAIETSLDATGQALTNLSIIAGKETAAGKALAIAASLINVYQGITKAIAVGGFAGIAQGIAVGLAGFAAIKNIIDTPVPGESGSGGVSAPRVQAPSFNVVGASQTSSLEQQLATEGIRVSSDTPLKSYVVASDVTTAQALDRQIEANAGF